MERLLYFPFGAGYPSHNDRFPATFQNTPSGKKSPRINNFRNPRLRVSWEGDDKLEIFLNQAPYIPDPHYTIQNVRLESRRGKTEVEKMAPYRS